MAMKKCDWCNKVTPSIESVTDASGVEYKVCPECASKFNSGVCWKCGVTLSLDANMRGMCLDCYGNYMVNRGKVKEASKQGLILNFEDPECQRLVYQFDIDMPSEVYDNWMLMGGADDVDAMNNVLNKRLWIKTKLELSGCKSDEELAKYFPIVEKLLDEHLTDLRCQKCKIVIIKNKDDFKRYNIQTSSMYNIMNVHIVRADRLNGEDRF